MWERQNQNELHWNLLHIEFLLGHVFLPPETEEMQYRILQGQQSQISDKNAGYY